MLAAFISIPPYRIGGRATDGKTVAFLPMLDVMQM
jgi:hypothetical protein